MTALHTPPAPQEHPPSGPRRPGAVPGSDAPPAEVSKVARLARARANAAQSDPLDLDARLALLTNSLRWATVSVGLIAGADTRYDDEYFLISAAALMIFALWQTVRSRDGEHAARITRLAIPVEMGLALAVILLTGGLNSPFVLAPMVPIVLGGFAWGHREVVGIAYATVTAVALAALIRQSQPSSQRSAGQLAIVFLLCGVLGAFTRRLVNEVGERHAQALDQVTRMGTANELLVALHGVAQTLPASLDLGEVLDSTRTRLRNLFTFSTLVVLVRDKPRQLWSVDLVDGIRLPPQLSDAQLAPGLARAAESPHAAMVWDEPEGGAGTVSPMSRSGLYAPLRARGQLVGIIALEHTQPGAFTSADANPLSGLTGALALSVDNALWFSRLRSFGADAERARIAREIHDRLAQSFAYVAFELERLSAVDELEAANGELLALRDVVRGTVTDLRETLYQLRATVDEDNGLEKVAAQYVEKFTQRTGIAVEWSARAEERLPIQVEQELWRIAQEALTNIERHARATRASLRWTVSGRRARLEVADNGRGFRPSEVVGEHYGLVGMHERADAIGALVTIDSRPGRGTRVLVELEVPR